MLHPSNSKITRTLWSCQPKNCRRKHYCVLTVETRETACPSLSRYNTLSHAPTPPKAICRNPHPDPPRRRLAFALPLPVRHHRPVGSPPSPSRRRRPPPRHRHPRQFRHHGLPDCRYLRQRRLRLLPAFSRRIRRPIRCPRIQDRPHVLGGRQHWRGPPARCRARARPNRRARALPVPHHRHHLLHQHLRRFQNHHRRPPHHPQLHPDSVDGLRFRRRRQQRRHPGTRHPRRQRQRQYQRRRLHPRRRLRSQRRPQPRHHFGTENPNFAI